MKKDPMIIRLMFLTSFFHSLVVSIVILLNINTLFAKHYENGLYIGKVTEFFINQINTYHVINRIVGIAIVGFLIYSFLYPIGQGAIIHYLHISQKNVRKAIKLGYQDFFPMMEFGIISLFLSPTIFWLTILKLTIS